jgi:formimidoylglutamate deiminase
MRSGFGAAGLREDQRRFAATPDSVLRIAEAVRAQSAGDPRITAGVACIRCARSMPSLCAKPRTPRRGLRLPVHIHIAEQQQEVADCLERHGQRPIEWLLRRRRWTRAGTWCTRRSQPDELAALRQSGARIVLCPSTEANLGDGVFDLPDWLGAAAAGRSAPTATSRAAGARNCGCSNTRSASCCASATSRRAPRVRESTAAALFDGALEGGSAAAGVPLAGLAVGQRADCMVMESAARRAAGARARRPGVFESVSPAAGGVRGGPARAARPIRRRRSSAAMRSLWSA